MMKSWLPLTFWGWIGLAVLAFTILYHKSLTVIGMILALALFYFLYFYWDEIQAPATT